MGHWEGKFAGYPAFRGGDDVNKEQQVQAGDALADLRCR